MRILMLDNEFPPLGGGTGVVNLYLLKELSRYSDIWIDLVTSSRTRRNYEKEIFAERITIYKVPVDNRNIHHSSNRELIRYAWRGLRQSYALAKHNCYDQSFAFAGVPAGAISYALKLSAGLPYLLSLQGPDVPGFEARYNYLYPLLKPFLRRIWSEAGIVTAISKEHQRLAHETLPELEIPIIYNGVDTDAFRPAMRSSQPAEINILCVGRLIERKGQHHLLRAFAELRVHFPKCCLTLIGTGDAEVSLKRLAEELNIIEAINFAGFLPHSQMPAIYQRADIFVLPSQSEGMSIALLEALASGLPVIVTDTGGTDELILEGINGFIVKWGDVNALKDALTRLIQDMQRRTVMGEASRRMVLKYSWAEIAKRYVEAMQSMLVG
ncbi:MAG: 1,2-diacylglycerol 3-glucosyltransferase [Chloroflexota bacterium]|nr:MAG: 1,2-diacylglycerol 3-glucosyltransferase [Chloroflexota bacterium]